MPQEKITFTTVDAYIASFDKETGQRLKNMRRLVRLGAPNAEERMTWQMPSYYQYGAYVCHFAPASSHMGFYPGSEVLERFADRLEGFKWAKGSLQLPYSKELPEALIVEMIEWSLNRNKEDFHSTEKRLSPSIDILLDKLSAPAKRAIEGLGVTALSQLTKYTKNDLAALHGIGAGAMEVIETVMGQQGYSFKA